MAYESPYGRPEGLAERLAEWERRLATDSTYPWTGTGILEDLKLAAQVLNLEEFAQRLRTIGSEREREFADEILRNGETIEAMEGATRSAGLANYDPVAAIETLTRERDEARRKMRAVRLALAEKGVLDVSDDQTELPDLLRVLLS